MLSGNFSDNTRNVSTATDSTAEDSCSGHTEQDITRPKPIYELDFGKWHLREEAQRLKKLLTKNCAEAKVSGGGLLCGMAKYAAKYAWILVAQHMCHMK